MDTGRWRIIGQITVLFMIWATAVQGQDYPPEEQGQHHDHYHNEFGIANSLVYLGTSNEFSYGLHFHYVHNIHETKFGFGLGYERIFDEHGHNTIGVIGSFRPVEHWGIHVSPGIAFEDTESDHMGFALHLETTYEFEVGPLHLGPLLEYAWDTEDYHISVGLHLGIGF